METENSVEQVRVCLRKTGMHPFVKYPPQMQLK